MKCPNCSPSRGGLTPGESSAPISEVRTAPLTVTEGMVRLEGGRFLMGTDYKGGFAGDGEGPVVGVRLRPFHIDARPVSNQQFAEFIHATGYRTEAEQFGWSFVFSGHIPAELHSKLVADTALAAPWWCKVFGANWHQPEGPDSSVLARESHPVVHVSWNDAAAFARWAGKRLPTEAEWEFAARGGLEQKLYPWGDDLTPDGHHMCNIWQGEFPDRDSGEDGWTAPAPADEFPPNAFGIYGTAGNVWEWCSDWFDARWRIAAPRNNPAGPLNGTAKVLKGGSYLCHESYCNRYRTGARTSNTPDSSTTNIGFRCAL